MKNAELIFKSADFSRETDFKNRLRTQLFDDYMKPSLIQNSFSVEEERKFPVCGDPEVARRPFGQQV